MSVSTGGHEDSCCSPAITAVITVEHARQGHQQRIRIEFTGHLPLCVMFLRRTKKTWPTTTRLENKTESFG